MPTFEVIETLTLQHTALIDAPTAEAAEKLYGEIVGEASVREDAELVDAQLRAEEVSP